MTRLRRSDLSKLNKNITVAIASSQSASERLPIGREIMGIREVCDNSAKQKSTKRANWRVGAIMLALVLPFAGQAPQMAYAETYPNRTITIVVPDAAGGAVDHIARLIQPGLAQALGQTVIVVDRPGAS